MISEQEIIKQLENGEINVDPLKLSWFEKGKLKRIDGLLRVKWENTEVKFAVEVKAKFTPKSITQAIYLIKEAARSLKLLPLLIAPYLSEESLKKLEKNSVSGIDLCGNSIVLIPGEILVLKSGKPNIFPDRAPIKNVYRKNSSMVGRLFLTQPLFEKVGNVLNEVNARNPLSRWNRQPTTFSMVSKVLKTLEEDLIISRKGNTTRLLQPDKLLRNLSNYYEPPMVKTTKDWKFPREILQRNTKTEILAGAFQSKVPAMITGKSSVLQYAMMQPGDKISIYCLDLEDFTSRLPGTSAEQFADISIMEVKPNPCFFDCRKQSGVIWASPVQCYLELATGDKRDQETSNHLEFFHTTTNFKDSVFRVASNDQHQ